MEADTALLKAAQSMKPAALVEIFDNYSSPLYNYALRLSRDPVEADQIVGDVFAKLLDQLSDGNGPSTNLRAYLYQMTFHLIVDKSRLSRREAPLEMVEFSAGNTRTLESSLENHLLLDTLLVAIRNDLTEDQRHVIILRFLEGFNLQQTAEIIGKKVQNVRVIQNRGITKLRQLLNKKVSK